MIGMNFWTVLMGGALIGLVAAWAFIVIEKLIMRKGK